jgi:hypothetical protein
VRALNSTTRLAAELRVDLAEVEGKDHFAENELSVEATTQLHTALQPLGLAFTALPCPRVGFGY